MRTRPRACRARKCGVRDNSKVAAEPAPDLTLKDLDGKDVSLAQYKGKVVLVNFWATWCEPCRVEIPWLIEMQQKYGAQGFTILGVAMDDEGHSIVAPWVQKERFDVNGDKSPMNYPIVIGNDAAADKFGGLIRLSHERAHEPRRQTDQAHHGHHQLRRDLQDHRVATLIL